ncbi:hypothetical protein [Bacillus cereus]
MDSFICTVGNDNNGYCSNFNLGRYQEYIDVMLVILAAAGVISNLNAGKWFADKQYEGDDK